jgi:hypothetical protein
MTTTGISLYREGTGRNGRRQSKAVEEERRRAIVLEMVRRGFSYEEIRHELLKPPKQFADEAGTVTDWEAVDRHFVEHPVPCLRTIQDDVRAVLKSLREQQADVVAESQSLDLARLDVAMQAILPMVRTGDLKAIRELREIIRLRMNILGYAAPIRIDVLAVVKDWAEANGFEMDFVRDMVEPMIAQVVDQAGFE